MTQLEALALSLVLEVPLVLVLGRRWVEDWRRLALVAFAATLLTHPFAWNGFIVLRPYTSWAVRALLVEGGIALVESAMYAWLALVGPRRGLALGFVANAWSFGIGLLVFRVLSKTW